MSDELMTPAEHRVIALLAEAYDLYCGEVVLHGSSRANDVAEFAAQLHVLQHTVMAQAAARAYPELYRQAGLGLGARRPGYTIVTDPCKYCGRSLDDCKNKLLISCCDLCDHS